MGNKEPIHLKKYAPDARWYNRPLCWIQGHTHPVNERGWTAIYCQVCGHNSAGITLLGYWYRAISRLQWGLVWIANHLENPRQSPSNWPPFRRVDGKYLKELGTKHSCDAYSYEHLKSMVDQGSDQLISRFISEEGWVEITKDNADEMLDLINDSFEAESNRQERKQTLKAAGLPED